MTLDFCPECGTMSTRYYVEAQETLPVLGEPITVQSTIAHCTACNQPVEDRALDSASLDAAYAEYRRRHGLTVEQGPPYERAPVGEVEG